MRGVFATGYVDDLAKLAPTTGPLPAIGADEVLVRVRAVALNPVDVAIATGKLHKLAPFEFPGVLGWDLSGEVVRVGEGATAFSPGDAVYATMGFGGGAFAEFAAVPADKLAHAPKRLGHPERAALPLVACTTIQAMALTDLQPGGRVLVLGGAGGVGSVAVQWLRHVGVSRVVATASETKLETVRKLGAEVIDYRNEDWSERLAGADFDVVYDTVGDRDAPARATKVMRDGGHFVTIAGPAGDAEALGGKHHFHFCVIKPSATDLAKVTAAVDKGDIDPLIFKRFAFEKIADAYALCAQRVAVGKIVVAV